MTVNHAPESSVDDDSGINLALLAALPAATRVLELGCATGRLGRRYKRAHPACTWIGVDVNAASLDAARLHLDDVVQLNLDVEPLDCLGTGFDLIVLGDVLEHLRSPETLLRDVLAICTPDARLVCCIPNMSHVSVIERLVRADIMYDPVGLLDATHLRFLAPRSAFKMLLDAGWLPNAAGGYSGGHPNSRFAQAIVDAALALGIPRQSAELNVYTYQLIISCGRRPPAPVGPTPTALSVIVFVADETQLELNLLRSPGLREIGAQVIVCRGNPSAAAAVASSLPHASAEWLLVCAEDAYFPRGSGFELLALLARIAPAQAAQTLLGIAGVGVDEHCRPVAAGLMVDRRALCDFPATDRAIALADVAVVMHRSSPLTIDPALGRHLWATDLCLQSIHGPTARFAQIVRVPVFHNSVDDGSISTAFAASAHVLASKYPQLASITTMHAEIRSDGTLCAPVFTGTAG